MNVLTAGLLSGGQDLFYLLLIGVVVSFFYMAGMSFNDVCDVDRDRATRPDRPIPSGQISLHGAMFVSVGLAAAGLVLLALAPYWQGMLAGLVLLAAIAAYDLHHKRNPWSVLIMASCRLLVYVVASYALTGALAPQALFAGLVQFGYIVALSLAARRDNAHPFPFPLIPWLLAGICLVDGMVLSLLLHPVWLLAGIVGVALTRWGQFRFRGD